MDLPAGQVEEESIGLTLGTQVTCVTGTNIGTIPKLTQKVRALQHRCNTATTPLQHHCNTAATPLQHRCYTAQDPQRSYAHIALVLLLTPLYNTAATARKTRNGPVLIAQLKPGCSAARCNMLFVGDELIEIGKLFLRNRNTEVKLQFYLCH